MTKINFLNIPIDALTMQETVQKVEVAIKANKQIHHTVVNACKIAKMDKDLNLRESVLSADIINADGQSIVWSANFFKKVLPERVSGIDLMKELVELSFEKGYRCFFFGAEEEVVSKLVELYKEKYSENIIAGYRSGFFNKTQELEIANQIVESKANILFVAMSSPLKENFLNKYKEIFNNINFIMGVGGSFDVIAGKVKRAPLWIQKIGLEWLFRVYQEPGRLFIRYLIGNLRFLGLVIKATFKSK